MAGESWFGRMSAYRWKLEPDPDKKVPGQPIERDDDIVDADRYLAEAVDGFPSRQGSPISDYTLSGKRRTRGMV
jgi:hypothetical protein